MRLSKDGRSNSNGRNAKGSDKTTDIRKYIVRQEKRGKGSVLSAALAGRKFVLFSFTSSKQFSSEASYITQSSKSSALAD